MLVSTVTIPENIQLIEEKDRKRKRVLLICHLCSPYCGSEAGCGWHHAIETAKYFDTWVLLVSIKQQENDIKRYLQEHGEIPGLHFCFVKRNRFENCLRRIPGFWYVYYNLWHRRAYRTAVRLHEEFQFDIVHLANLIGFREPGYLWKFDAPFIWGPVGGTQNYPWRFLPYAGIRGAFKEGLRNILNILQFCFSRRVRKAAKRAAVLLTSTSGAKLDFERIHKVNPLLMQETGSTSVTDRSFERGKHQGPLRILWSGELDHHKALHFLIAALSNVPVSLSYELRILGKGPLKKRWQRFAQRTGVNSHCRWMGWLPHDEAISQYYWADVFVFTSLRDNTGTVILEALSNGVPVICLDHQGAGDIVTNDCGIKIPVTTPNKVILQLRDALVYLAENRKKLEALSHGSIKRSRKFLWSLKVKRIARIYNEVLAT